MTVIQNDYSKLLYDYNYSDAAGQTLLDDTTTTLDDDHIKVEIVNGKYQFNYFLFNSISSMAGTGYYDVPGNDIGNDGVYDSFYNYLAEDSSNNKDPSLTTKQVQAIQNVLHSSLTDAYSVSIEDVANIQFNSGTAANTHITFGQLQETHPGLGPTTGAGTVIYDPSSPENTKERNGDIWLNQDLDVDNDGTSDWITSGTNRGDLTYHVILHEVLHALGIDVYAQANTGQAIDSQKYSVTSYNPVPGMEPDSNPLNVIYPSGLQLMDIAALQAIYGADTTTRLGDTTYKEGQGFAADVNSAFIYTIWDADAGANNDTIDASSYSDGVVIDLREGHFSSIGKSADSSYVGSRGTGLADDNVAIAYGAKIESAIGTNNDDTFRGTEGRANSFDGRGGSDLVDYSHYTTAIDVNLSTGSDNEGNTLTSIEKVKFGASGGTVTGGSGDEEIFGGSGDDNLKGGAGSNTIYGGAGSDILAFDIDIGYYNSYASGDSGVDYFQATSASHLPSGEYLLQNGTLETDAGKAENIEGLIGTGVKSNFLSMGWLIDVNQTGLDSDYSQINQALSFNLNNGNDWTVSETQGSNHDVYSNFFKQNGYNYGSKEFWGTHYGDTVTFGNESRVAANAANDIYLGNGDDVVTVTTLGSRISGSSLRFSYSDGDDTFHFTDYNNTQSRSANRSVIRFEPDITAADLSFTTLNEVVTYNYAGNVFNLPYKVLGFDLEVSVQNKGQITLTNMRLKHGAGADRAYDTADDTYQYYTPSFSFKSGGYLNKFSQNLDFEGATLSNQTEGTSVSDVLTGSSSGDTYNGYSGNDILSGGAGNDTIRGHSGEDVLNGGEDTDFLYGGLGNDILRGDEGNDQLNGGQGEDYLYGGVGTDTLCGDNQNDILFGEGGDDYLYGGFANDVLSGGSGNDFKYGDEGDDTYVFNLGDGQDTIEDSDGDDAISLGSSIGWNEISLSQAANSLIVNFTNSSSEYLTIREHFNADDTKQLEKIIYASGLELSLLTAAIQGDASDNNLVGTAEGDLFLQSDGDDTYDGGSAVDIIDYSSATSAVEVQLNYNRADKGRDGSWDDTLNNIENVVTTAYNDKIYGDAGANVLVGLAGNDTILAGDNDDSIDGGDGKDYLYGEAGNDTISGGSGNDQLWGASGDDILNGDAGLDALNGFEGNDILNGGDDNDTLYGDHNSIDESTYSYSGDDILNGGAGHDNMRGGRGSDTLNGGAGLDTLYGGSGNDTLNGGSEQDFLYGDSGLSYTDSGDDILNGEGGDDRMYGQGGNDIMNGGDGWDVLWAGDGDDVLHGEGGRDILYADAGNDILTGGDDIDYLWGGSGNDNLDAGSGIDVLVGEEDDDVLQGGDGDDELYGDLNTLDESVYSYSGSDILNGGAGNDDLRAGRGTDILNGDEGNDALYGGSGNDALYGGTGDDYLYGDGGLTLSYTGDDVLNGGAGFDRLYGNDGNDTLYAGEGADYLYGGNGADTFKIYETSTNNNDMAYAFDFVEGTDIIDIADILTGYDPLNDALSDFVNIAQGSHTTLQVDRDGSGTAYTWDNILRLQNNTTLETDVDQLVTNGTLLV